MGICWTCIGLGLLTLLAGVILDRLILWNKLKHLRLKADDSDRYRNQLSSVNSEYNQFKAKSSNTIQQNERALKELQDQNRILQSQVAESPDPSSKEQIIKWKSKYEELSNELQLLKAKESSVEDNQKSHIQIEDLKTQLTTALRKIRKQDVLLLEAKKESFPSNEKKAKKIQNLELEKYKAKAEKFRTKYKKLKANLKKDLK